MRHFKHTDTLEEIYSEHLLFHVMSLQSSLPCVLVLSCGVCIHGHLSPHTDLVEVGFLTRVSQVRMLWPRQMKKPVQGHPAWQG